ncbi:ABC transporter permease [Leadbettera azotonutricia]|uniref:Putative ABC transporter, permease protein n=1 Tax=Leadbettera azotonutricia (strain ATCC BAA-888 / DSM 13862 / ZAS-9) TaxID=545695 RepID=F5YCU0_LEAAZ|nr:ABC transporter permease subunit [Leadbettera azotonutricia]AEF80508.1 putative ABC transporter, permease protein [Leadbettera azotonutricia ZAS-9]
MKQEKAGLWLLAGIIVLLILWQLGAFLFGSSLILPGPLPVIEKFGSLFGNPKFLTSLGFSFLRVIGGMLISVPLGLVFGIASGLDNRAGAFLKPLFSIISATPVMSVILICFLILGSEKTPVFTAFLMVFPVMAANTIEGIHQVDPKLKELFIVYRMNPKETLRYLYIPSIMPFMLGGLKSSLSLCWKVVVAAEVLVQPLRSIGTGMQQAKAQLETPELFAWTLATVLAAALTQFMLGLVIKRKKP